MGETSIEWTHRPGTVGRTWNPTQGCSRKSEGCRHCYAERMAARFAENGWSKGLINLRTGKWNGTVRLAAHKLLEPLSWRQPATVFVNSMSDLFHEALTNEEIAAVFGVMAATPQHTYLILTKRAERMREWFEWVDKSTARHWHGRWGVLFEHLEPLLGAAATEAAWMRAIADEPVPKSLGDAGCHAWPLPNVWLGVSVEDQDAADERIPALLRTPAAIRFLSCEPLISRVDLHAIQIPDERAGLHFSALQRHHDDCYGQSDTTIDWVIVGAESGHGARPCATMWLRALRNQCLSAGVPLFLKQAVENHALEHIEPGYSHPIQAIACGPLSDRKGRGHGGDVIGAPYLDGRQHLEFPEPPHDAATA